MHLFANHIRVSHRLYRGQTQHDVNQEPLTTSNYLRVFVPDLRLNLSNIQPVITFRHEALDDLVPNESDHDCVLLVWSVTNILSPDVSNL